MKNSTQRLLTMLLASAFFAACSRPVAHFQPSQREYFTSPKTETVAALAEPATPTVAPASVPVAQANAAMQQIDALVRNDNALATNKRVEKRLNRVRTMLASATAEATAVSAGPNTAASVEKAGLAKRLMVKAVNKRINKHLAPNAPKAGVNAAVVIGVLAAIAGVVVLIVGSSTLGVILLLAGLLVALGGILAG